MATASFMTLSPKTIAYKSTSTLRSWKIARTVTKKKIIKNKTMVQYREQQFDRRFIWFQFITTDILKLLVKRKKIMLVNYYTL